MVMRKCHAVPAGDPDAQVDGEHIEQCRCRHGYIQNWGAMMEAEEDEREHRACRWDGQTQACHLLWIHQGAYSTPLCPRLITRTARTLI